MGNFKTIALLSLAVGCASHKDTARVPSNGSDTYRSGYDRLQAGERPTPDFLSSENCSTISLVFQVLSLKQIAKTRHPGHTAIGIENDFYDFGPRYSGESVIGMVKKGIPAAPYLDTRLTEDGDASMTDVFEKIHRAASYYKPYIVQISVPKRQAQMVKEWWDHQYAALAESFDAEKAAIREKDPQKREETTYRIVGRQCTSAVYWSLLHAGIIDEGEWTQFWSPWNKQSVGGENLNPMRFFKYASEKMTSNCGYESGRPSLTMTFVPPADGVYIDPKAPPRPGK